MGERPRVPWAVIFIFALAVLFETWIWGSVMGVMRRLVALVPWVAFKQAFVRLIDWLPVWALLFLFCVPFVLNEIGCFGCVVLIAMGHVVTGTVGYFLLKGIGLGLLAAIFDLSRHKLLTVPWFAYLYGKFQIFHDYAHGLVQPYKEAAIGYLARLRARAHAYFARRSVDAEGNPS